MKIPHFPACPETRWRLSLARRWRLFLLPSLLLLAALPAARAATQTWIGNGVNGNWATVGNFTPGGIANEDSFIFDGNNYLASNFNNLNTIAVSRVSSLTFNAGAGAFTLSGGQLRVTTSAGITNLSANLQTISLSTLGAYPSQTWDAGTGGLRITSAVSMELIFGSTALTVTGVGNTAIEGSIADNQNFYPASAGSLIKTGVGTLTLTGSNNYNGGTTVKSGTLAVGAGGVINHSGTNTLIGNVSGDNGSLLISGGRISNKSGIIGNAAGSQGSAAVTSGTWTNASDFFVGNSGTGALSISNGTVTAVGTSYLGNVVGSSGTASVLTGGLWSTAGNLAVGNFGVGELTINGGTVTDTLALLGFGAGSKGTVTVTSGTWTNTSSVVVGLSGTGILQIDGGRVSDAAASIGQSAGSTGVATVTGGTWSNAGDFYVGNSGTGSLTISGGTVTTGSTSYIGGAAGGSGTATVSGGLWNTSGFLSVGNLGNGTLSINGGTVTNQLALLGFSATSTGIATVTSGTWINAAGLVVGLSGTGILTVSGGVVSDVAASLGQNAGSAGTGTVSGGTWNTSTDLFVGNSGTGTLNLTHTGVVNVGAGSGTLTVANAAGSHGTLNIGTGGTAGTLLAAIVNGGTGAAVVNFNHTGSLAFATNLTGLLSVAKLGSGATTLTGTNTYTGTTTISAGKLAINGANTGAGAVIVQSGGSLAGSGSIAGIVTVEDGGILAPGNSAGTLSVASLTLNSTSVLDYELGPPAGPNDRIDVAGNLVLDGILNITDLGGFGAGTYLLMNYGGSLTDSGLTFGVVPGAFDFSLDTTGNQVNLTVTLADGQYWNGPNELPVGSVTGGSGTWNNVLTNWTNTAGDASAAWTGTLPAIFSGSAGTVTVADTISVAEMRFLTDGYVFDGAGELAISGTTLAIKPDAGLGVEIGTLISGTGGVAINGGGTVSLTGSNSYEGGTQVLTGTLLVEDDHALGTGVLALEGATTFGSTTSAVLENNVVVNGDVNLLGFLEFEGTVDLGVATRTITFADGSDVCFMGAITGSDGLTLQTAPGDLVSVMMCGDDNNTYTGLTTVGSGVALLLQKDPDTRAIAGDLLIQDGALVGLMSFGPQTVTQIAPTATVTIEGTGELNFFAFAIDPSDPPLGQTIAGLFGDGRISSSGDLVNLTVESGDFSGTIGDLCGCGSELALIKDGAGTLLLSGSNNYVGGTTILAGVLQTANTSALGVAGQVVPTANVALAGGTLAPVGTLTIDTLNWTGGTIASVLGTNTSFVNVLGNLTLTGVGQFDFTGDSGFMTQTEYAILAAANLSGFSVASFSGNTLVGVTPTFTLVGNTLYVSFLGANSGPVIQNTGPYFTPRNSDFQVNGPVRTGSLTESNIINSLTFADGSSVLVFNNLTVTSGSFNVAIGSASMTGGNVIVPGAFNLNGLGTFIAGSNFAIGGDANINGGNLVIDGLFAAGGNMNVNSTVTVNGSASVAGSLNTNASTVTVNGLFAVGGNANLNNGTELLVNAGGSMAVGQATNINFGSTAVINGQLASPQVNVNGGGLLKGAGLIVSNVWNNGTVAPGNSPGMLSIDGNYTQTGNGTLEIEPGDLLWVSGRATLAGTLKLVAAGKLKYGQQITFLQAGSISGDFDQILVPNPAKNRGRLLVDGGTGTLLIAPTSYTLVAETGNQRNVAKALDSFISARADDREEVSIALDLQSAEQYPAAFDQIAPSFYESLADITIEQANAQNQNLAQRASALRLGARGFQAIGIEAPLVHDKDGKSVMDAKDGKNILSYGPDNKWGVWVQGNGNFARITSASQVPNYRFESGGFLAGADYRWSENFVTGLYGGYQGTLAKYNEGGRTTINSVQFGGYASYDNGGFYADAIVGGGYSAYSVRRPINFSTIDRTARSRPDGGQFTTYLDFGYDWKLGNFTVGPILSGQYTYAGIAPFTETGADSLDLSVGQQNANSLRTSLGGRIAYTWKVSEKFTLIPEGRMFWQHEFLENPRNIGASLDGGDGPSFGYTTSTPDRDAVFAGAGLIGQFGPNWNAYFYYNADFGRQDYISHAISTGLNFKF